MDTKEKHSEYQYLDLLKYTLENGVKKGDFASGKGLTSIFGYQIRFDLSKGFPLLTTKKVFTRGITHELLWFLKGDGNIKYLIDRDVHIWDEWAYRRYKESMAKDRISIISEEEFIAEIKKQPADSEFVRKWGDLGYIYGPLWRRWPASDGRKLDQLKWAIWKLSNKKERERKHICVSAWNPQFTYEMAALGEESALPACHSFYQFNVAEGKLSLQLYQRSADLFLGVPFNIASYAMLTQIVAQLTDLELGTYVHTFGDAHIYADHFDQVKEQLSREPRSFPQLKINTAKKTIDDLVYEDFKVSEYDPYPTIRAPVTVVGGFDKENRGAYEKSEVSGLALELQDER